MSSKDKLFISNEDFEKTIYYLPRNISTDILSYNFLAQISQATLGITNDTFVFDFINNEWFDANISAVFGGIIHKLILEKNEVELINISPDLNRLFERNYFFETFMGHEPTPKTSYSSIIPCSTFLSSESEKFMLYLDEGLLSMSSLPSMTQRLKKKINERLLEIFINAHEHGNCGHLYCSGQYFPKKKKISVTLCDIGKTIRANVNKFLKSHLSGAKAIEWAVEEGNTTRTGSIPGGLGLSLIREFLLHNNGTLQIISCNGLWQENKGTNFVYSLNNRFQGTIVNIDINIDDRNYYMLSSE